ncbi:MAG: hypothetical protein LBK83_04850 [Treponema sp.]|nr:hypothetical protein [Treponema sp.]
MTFRSDEDVRKIEQFIKDVRYMREAQKRYYSSRPRERMLLLHAQELEREVEDSLIALEWEIGREEARQKHPELFPAE